MTKRYLVPSLVCVLFSGLCVLLGVVVMGNKPVANLELDSSCTRLYTPDQYDVKIVHISDTHNNHDDVTADLIELGDVDMLIHTGDFSADGTFDEYDDFNRWLGEVKHLFPRGIYVVLGNHDYKFLNGLSLSDELVATLAKDDTRRKFFQEKLTNARVLDNESIELAVGKEDKLSLNIYGCPWYPFQYSPTHPDRVNYQVKNDHDRVFQEWAKDLPEEKKNKWNPGEAWKYDEIPTKNVDILLSHIPPFGVLDYQPGFTNWGSSDPFLEAVKNVKPRAHLFGHVHAQRGYWEKVDAFAKAADGECDTKEVKTTIIGGVQYATTTNEDVKNDLLVGSEESGIQFIANTAMMSDRTVQPFAKKKIAGKPRLICGSWVARNGTGQWHFSGSGGGAKYS